MNINTEGLVAIISKLQYDLDVTKRKLQEVSAEKDNALSRLSSIASAKLTYNNPNIADLSDRNRPQKLGEMFGELYDNEWTDAVDRLTEIMEEKKAIILLRSVLQYIYEKTKKASEDQYRNLQNALFQKVDCLYMEPNIRKRMSLSTTEVEPKESDETELIEKTKRRKLKLHMCRLCLACKLSGIGWVVLAYYVCVEKWFCTQFKNPSFEFNATMLTLNGVCLVFGAVYFCSIVLYFIEQKTHKQDRFKNQIDQEIRLSENQTELERLKEELRMKDKTLKRERLESEQRIEEEKVARQNAEARFEMERIEKEKALTRLSAYAGEKLRLNNPGLADLSDEHRPNKLAEKFSELYDNDWTDALDSLADTNQTEESQTQDLLQTLKAIYGCCMQFAERQRTRLVLDITKPSKLKDLPQETDVPGRILSKVIDLQKQTASDAITDIRNYVLANKEDSANNTSMQKYKDRCIEYCWMMAIQDPPMMLNFGPAQNEEFNKDVFRCYTRTGDKVEFVVWPAVFLYENGPLVTKGVLQPIAK